jgi:hypothetical protein
MATFKKKQKNEIKTPASGWGQVNYDNAPPKGHLLPNPMGGYPGGRHNPVPFNVDHDFSDFHHADPSSHPYAPHTPTGAGPVVPGSAGTAPGEPNGPTTQPFVPPRSMKTTQDRLDAQKAYDSGMGDSNYDLYLAALQYGDPNTVAQYQQFGGANAPSSLENSDLAQIGRTLDQTTKQLGVSRNQGNTFFSGQHLQDLSNLNDEASRQRGSALDRFRDALVRIGKFQSGLADALGGANTRANIEDWTAWAATQPDPGAAMAAAEAGTAQPAPTGGPQGMMPPTNPAALAAAQAAAGGQQYHPAPGPFNFNPPASSASAAQAAASGHQVPPVGPTVRSSHQQPTTGGKKKKK